MVLRQVLLRVGAALLIGVALTAQESPRRHACEPISLDLREVDLRDFFRLMHEVSGLNIVLDPSVRGTATLYLLDVPWDPVLDIVVKKHGLVTELQDKVLRVMTVETAKREQQARRELSQRAQSAAARQTVTYTLSYARAQVKWRQMAWGLAGARTKEYNAPKKRRSQPCPKNQKPAAGTS